MQLGDTSTLHSALIVGLAGCELLPEEARFLESQRPCGIIIFSRNFSTNAQLRRLIDDARNAAASADLLVLIDQEGGRVQRLRGLDWPDFPSAAAFGALYEKDADAGLEAARLCNQWLGAMLREVGINTNCAPCLDIPVAGANGIIGDRAYGDHTSIVSAVGGAVVAGLMGAGVVPVIKHIPGHGRARLDSHVALPVVDADRRVLDESDFVPFAALRTSPAAMSAHVTFSAIDDVSPASVSMRVIQETIRRDIGFDGLLMSDDLSMHALSGPLNERCRSAFAAGSDVVLHCNGVMAEMNEVAAVAPKLSGLALRRYQRCQDIVRSVPASVSDDAAQSALQQVRNAVDSRAASGA